MTPEMALRRWASCCNSAWAYSRSDSLSPTGQVQREHRGRTRKPLQHTGHALQAVAGVRDQDGVHLARQIGFEELGRVAHDGAGVLLKMLVIQNRR
jgi:hypothetical protein